MKFELRNGMPVPVMGGDDRPVDDVMVFDIDGLIAKFPKWTRAGLELMYRTAAPFAVDDERTQAHQAAVEKTLADWAIDPAKVLVREAEFPELEGPDLALFLMMCEQAGVNPWKREAYPLWTWRPGRRRAGRGREDGENTLVLGVPIKVQRAIAHRTGQYAGFKITRTEEGDGRRPIRTVVEVYRIVNGVKCAFEGECVAADFDPGPDSTSLYGSKPYVCGVAIAEASGLRRAFPDELDKVYEPAEFMRPRPRPMVTPPAEPERKVVDEISGQTYEAVQPGGTLMELHRELQRIGMDRAEGRNALIEYVRSMAPDLEGDDPQMFASQVVEEARRNRRKWA